MSTSFKSSNVYHYRSHLLLTGFVRNVNSSGMMNEFDIFMDKITCYIVKTDHYQFNCITKLTEEDCEQFLQNKNEHKIIAKYENKNKNTISIKTKKIYDDTNCISFIAFKLEPKSNFLYRTFAMDKNNNIIANTEWKLYHAASYKPRRPIRPKSMTDIEKYFSSKIDLNNKESVNVDEWLNALQLND
eukprot:527549_1